jgi:MtrB/PioB family decaheme-associated outer membrane protein
MNARAAGLALALLGVSLANAQEAAPAPVPDTSGWSCRFCPFEDGWSAWVEPRLGYVSDSSARFGDYTGLDDAGAVGDLSAAWRFRGAEGGERLDLWIDRIGLGAGAFGMTLGRQGRYMFRLSFDELPHFIANDGLTPFEEGRGGAGLPSTWVSGGSTGAMTELGSSLRHLSLQQTRERTEMDLALRPYRVADLRVGYRRDEIRGTGMTGASFLTLASQLPRPISQTLDRLDASLAWHNTLAHAQLALESSFFTNRIKALVWENPYNPPSPGATVGALGQAPDNSAHRLGLKVGTAPGTPLQLAGQVAIGRMQQDDRFLPATVNPDEATVLPRDSLDARVNTTLVSARAAYGFSRALRLSADVLRDHRDNETPVGAYTQVVTDTFSGDVRTNVPYGFTRNRWRVSAERRAAPRIAVGMDDDRRERRLHGVGRTEERRYWGRLSVQPIAGTDLKVRVAHARREGMEYEPGADVPAQNPLLRAPNTADRRRDETRADFSFGDALMLTSLHAGYARDEYPGTVIGRTSGSDYSYGGNVALQPAEGLSVSAFASHRSLETGQAGSQAFGVPDWSAEQEDVSNVVGAHLGWQAPRGIELGADYVYATSEGTTSLLAAAGDSGFPMLLTRWHDARLFGRYALRPNLALRLDLIYERYSANDWALDGLAPDTVPNLLALGQGTQDGSVFATLVGVRYEFGGTPAAAD